METIVKLKKRILELAFKAKEGHIASAFSILDILWVLYDKVMTKDDQFILSKGHASLALYAVLEEKGLITGLDSFCQYDSHFGGHPMRGGPILASTGSLGHGLPMAVGLALAKKIKNEPGRVFCLIGDGECNEGSIWESALLANHHKLDNLVVVIDQNRSSERALRMGDLAEKFEAFGWRDDTIDGHDHYEIEAKLQERFLQPYAVVAENIKGQGIPEMEDNPAWHHKAPTEEEFNRFVKQLDLC